MASILSNSSGKGNIQWTSNLFNGGTSLFVSFSIRTAAERDMLAHNRAVHIWFSTFIDKNANLHSLFGSVSSDLILWGPQGLVDNRFHRSSVCTSAQTSKDCE